MKKGIHLICVLVLSCIISGNVFSQSQENNVPINFFLGASYTIAPSFEIDGVWTVNESTSASFYSVFADLVINSNLIGRAQISSLAVSSLSEELSEELESGFQMNGSLGYNAKPGGNDKISIPIMATIGYATVKERSVRDAGMQLGATLGLNYALNQKISASSTLRYLKGVEFSDGAKFNQIDISFGVLLRLL